MSETPEVTRPLGEKERVYAELERTRRKCAALKREVKALRTATSAREAAIARLEASEYRKALSNIAYRLDNAGVSEDELRRIVSSALLLRGLKGWQRERIQAPLSPSSDSSAALSEENR